MGFKTDTLAKTKGFLKVTGFKTDTLAKIFELQIRTLVFDKITILSKVRCHQKSILNRKTTQFKMSHDHVLQT